MSDDADWGPWVDHDGKGCPVVGLMIESEERSGRKEVHIAGSIGDGASQWFWDGRTIPSFEIIRYRIRKPKALRDLITIAAEPYAAPPVISPEGPQRQPAPVPA